MRLITALTAVAIVATAATSVFAVKPSAVLAADKKLGNAPTSRTNKDTSYYTGYTGYTGYGLKPGEMERMKQQRQNGKPEVAALKPGGVYGTDPERAFAKYPQPINQPPSWSQTQPKTYIGPHTGITYYAS